MLGDWLDTWLRSEQSTIHVIAGGLAVMVVGQVGIVAMEGKVERRVRVERKRGEGEKEEGWTLVHSWRRCWTIQKSLRSSTFPCTLPPHHDPPGSRVVLWVVV